MGYGQIAYAAYRKSRLETAADGSHLPENLDASLVPAWDAFAQAVKEGAGVINAYYSYLDVTKGVTVSGGIAPSWPYFTNFKPEIAFAWVDAASAVEKAAAP